MDAYLENINMNQKQTGTFETKIATISNEDERTRLVMTIPGISCVTALTIISEIVDINGFATAEKLVSCGTCTIAQGLGKHKKEAE